MKLYKTNHTRGALFHWTVDKACMELVSNMLDQGNYDYSVEESSEGTFTLRLTNYGVTLSQAFLLSGASDKRDNGNVRGIHGQGSIQSMVVLLNNDLSVKFYNGGILWTPRYEHCDVYNADVMVIQEDHLLEDDNNFTVEVSGLLQEDIDNIIQRTLEFQDREVLYSTKYGDLIANPEDGAGEVYVGGIYVCQSSNFKYSYNLPIKSVELNQDRNCVDNWELRKHTAKLWSLVEDKALLESAIESRSEDTSLVNSEYLYSSDKPSTSSNSQAEAIAKEYMEEVGTKVVVTDYEEYQEQKSLGNKNVHYESNTQKANLVKNSEYYQELTDNLTLMQAEKEEPVDVLRELFLDIECLLEDYIDKEDIRKDYVERMNALLDKAEYWTE